MIELSRLSMEVVAEQQRPSPPRPTTITILSPEQPQGQGASILDEEEYKIVRLVDKR